LGLWTGALWLTAYLRGSNAGMTEGTWMSFGLAGLRGLGMILAFGAIGFLLASIGRHTGLALGVALAVAIVGQIGVSIVLSMMQVKFFEQYLIPVHFYAWMNKQVPLESWPQTCAGNCEPEIMIISWGETGTIAGIVVAVLLVIAFWQMRRRDIA
jgi:ABC-type transport system involved in multi-copper enzyme maturation permease subunit